jgi:ferritin-like metal-binding protein YciE
MDQQLRDEFRAYRVETDDRINRLEKAVDALSASTSSATAEKAETKPATASEAKKA